MILVSGFQKNSFIDYPGKIASVVFLGGCNFRCYYCHNSSILCASSNRLNFDLVLDELKQQIGFVDGVVITGGEPTLHPKLVQIVKAIKRLGLLVKLDTNGTNSGLLKRLIDKCLIDFVAMDVKAPIKRYADIVCVKVNTDEIQRSVDFLIEQATTHNVNYMFRTTLAPVLNADDILAIGKLISGAKTFQLQQFVPNDFSNSHKTVLLPYTVEQAKEFAQLIQPHVEEVLMRGF